MARRSVIGLTSGNFSGPGLLGEEWEKGAGRGPPQGKEAQAESARSWPELALPTGKGPLLQDPLSVPCGPHTEDWLCGKG